MNTLTPFVLAVCLLAAVAYTVLRAVDPADTHPSIRLAWFLASALVAASAWDFLCGPDRKRH